MNAIASLVIIVIFVRVSASCSFATIIGGAVTGGDSLAQGGKFEKLNVPLPNGLGPTNSVGNDTFDDPNLYGFDENQNFIGAALLNVDVLPNGQEGVIPAQTEVASHYVFFDPPHGIPEQTGYVDFSSDVLAVITSRTNLLASDYLANTGVNYLSPAKRGLEKKDGLKIDPTHPNRLLIDWAAGSPGDYVRVLTKHTPPVRQYWALNGHYYEAILAQGGISWTDANSIAVARGGYLASISSIEENDFVFNLVKDPEFWFRSASNYFGPWIGGVQLPNSTEPAGGWGWSTHESFGFSHWAPQQPTDSAGSEDRIQFGGFSSIASYWNDLADGNSKYAQGFIVEYEANPAPFLSIASSGDAVLIKWEALTSRTYAVLWCSEIAGGSWTLLTNAFGSGAEISVADETDHSTRFYRIAY